MERMRATSQSEKIPLSDNRAQLALATFAFHQEHPEQADATHNEIMREWIEKHATDYRAFIDAEGDTATSLDNQALAALYERMRRREGETLH